MKRFIGLSLLALSALALGDSPRPAGIAVPRPIGLPAPRPAGIVVPRPVGLPVPPRPIGMPPRPGMPRPIGLPVGIVAPTPEFNDIVRINVGYGATNTMYNPNEVLRPYRGDLLRVSIPAYCGATTISQIGAWGKTLNGGQRLQLPLQLVSTNPGVGVNSWTYRVNNGQPATVREIGLAVTTFAASCEITFEQANSSHNVVSNECDPNVACPLYADNTRMCEARSSFATFAEDATGNGGNSCFITQALKMQICRAGYLPSQFQISCY